MVKSAQNSTNKGKKPLEDGQDEGGTQQELKDRENAMQQQLDQACQRVNEELHIDGMAGNSGAVDGRRQSIEIEETKEQLEDRLDQMNADIARMTKQLNDLKRKGEAPTSKSSESQAKKSKKRRNADNGHPSSSECSFSDSDSSFSSTPSDSDNR